MTAFFTQRSELVEEILQELPPYWADILRLRHGLKDGHSRSLAEVTRDIVKYGYRKKSRERIRQLERDALNRLREIIEEKAEFAYLSDYLED